MKLSKLLDRIPHTLLRGDTEIEVSDLVYDSRKASAGCVFVCMVGAVTDGHDFIPMALEKGARALIVEREVEIDDRSVTVIRVPHAREALALMSAAFFDYPARKLKTIGLTGTKGKTTSTYLIKSVLENAGKKVGLIGTIGISIGDRFTEAHNTTPESLELHKAFHEMVEAGCEYAVMEVSSQGLKYSRVHGVEFDLGVFTNLSPDHIGPAEHDSFEDYLSSKSLLFRQCKTGIVNADDEHTEAILQSHTCSVKTFAANNGADLRATDISLWNEGGKLGVKFKTEGDAVLDATVCTPGLFSVYNALVAISVCKHFGISDEVICSGLENATVKGRVESVNVSEDFSVIIDYAHNEVSTRSVLTTLSEYRPKRLICVFGCGGNRSKLRRYDMGEVSGNFADLSVITSDNPRDEDLADIIEDIKVGLHRTNGKYIVIPDRREAIRHCIKTAQKGDMIVLLGKGHQTYEEIRGVQHHFDEREVCAEIKAELGL